MGSGRLGDLKGLRDNVFGLYHLLIFRTASGFQEVDVSILWSLYDKR